MSETYHFVCDDCRKHIWSGQALYLYKYRVIADFLHDHQTHSLRFLSQNYLDDEEFDNYEEVEYEVKH